MAQSSIWKTHELNGDAVKYTGRAKLSSRNGPEGEMEGSFPPVRVVRPVEIDGQIIVGRDIAEEGAGEDQARRGMV